MATRDNKGVGKVCGPIKIISEDAGDEMETRDREITELRNTLKNLSTSPKQADLLPAPRNTLSPNDALQRRRAASLQIEGRIPHFGELDFVPEHLVSPLLHQDRAKFKGPLQRVVHDDMVDMGVVTAAKHPSLVNRRRSDPGRVSPALLQARLKYMGSGNTSEEEDREKPARPLSPRPLITGVPDLDTHYPASGLSVEGRRSPGWSSPRRRLSQPRHSACAAYGGIGSVVAGHESPRLRARKSRSNSLPIAVWPEKSALEVGEAIGALAMNTNDPGANRSGSPIDTLQPVGGGGGGGGGGGTQHTLHPSSAAQAGRCLSIEEPPLEAILEETGSRAQSHRRFSVPHSVSPSLYARAVSKPLKPLP